MQISGFTWDPTKAFAEMNAVLSYLPSIPPCFLLYLKARTGDLDLQTSLGIKHNRGRGTETQGCCSSSARRSPLTMPRAGAVLPFCWRKHKNHEAVEG